MARYWVGTTMDWHSAANWAFISGGAGGAGVPTASDDVFIDGGGNVLCWAGTPIVCNNFTILSTATEMNLFDQGGVINGDFEMQAGYFGPTGGGGYTMEFCGNWLNTGGTFAVGTGTGVDPTCEFSGTGKTYNLNQLSAAGFQNVLVSGTLTMSGTRLGIMNISQKLSITGTMTVNANGSTICDVDMHGTNAGFDVLTGTLNGTGRLWYRYRSNSVLPTTGTIKVRYFRVVLQDLTALLNAGEYTIPCEFELMYESDAQVVTLSSGRHTFYKLTIHGNFAAINDATLDMDANKAEITCIGKFDIYKDAFPSATFHLKFGDGTHIFRNSVDFYFSYSSGVATVLDVQAGKGTILLWPKGRTLVPL